MSYGQELKAKMGQATFIKGWVVLLAAIVCTIYIALLALSFGSSEVSLLDFFKALVEGDTNNPAYRIIYFSRLPRVLGALLAGSALAVAGTIMQAVLQNPLASPNIIGINNGAGFFVLATSVLLPGRPALLPLSAFLGALLTALVIFALAMGRGSTKLSLVLTGIAMSSILGAGMNVIMLLFPDAYIGASTFLVGGLGSVTMDSLQFAITYIVCGLAMALLLRREMNIIALGSNAAKALGMAVATTRFLLIATAAVLTGAAVSFAGLIGFVGLIVPHALRFLIGSDHRVLVPASIFAGAGFVTFCDFISRIVFSPYEVAVGILLSLSGGPFFIYLVIRSRRTHND